MDWMLQHEPALRLSVFALLLALLLLAQRAWPARGDGQWAARQSTNAALAVIDTLMLRVLFPMLAVGLAVVIHGQNGGLFARLDWPLWLSIPAAVLILDLAIYWQHRWMHAIPWLWRLHRVHHADTGFDVTTGVRFHPLEIALSMGYKLGLIWMLGPHPVAVLVFEMLLAAGALFTHTDVALPRSLDRRLRWLFVTPSMHRIHHSSWQPETDSNYGFHLSLWDRLFMSYRSEPRDDERRMIIGLKEFRRPEDQRLTALLLNPFRSSKRPSKDTPRDA
ncbi:sterol desaturase family protein [Wenzhouxiangella marina]|uniref:Sterol desaturase n=1 Tax=Wenzhouxiangella marina TaxID=1579979 RepID=A0A0K0XW05_9GAMM|nr:sterol desaturase family protein [Wenzhouxiangella marina]AKS41863.1 sterol desaturase [Wenzhouxiangella marina]MBB6086371.1 sterol desaturase/sphingolipid hydroxylase (fatty acid hydroxylase superfamily) [Wenzhouxiangella marina]